MYRPGRASLALPCRIPEATFGCEGNTGDPVSNPGCLTAPAQLSAWPGDG
jgi:hypothetical protein